MLSEISSSIAYTWESSGEYAKAINYYQKALEYVTDKLGDNHIETKYFRQTIELLKSKVKRE